MSDRPAFEELAAARLAYEQATDPAERSRLHAELEGLRARLGTTTRGGLDDLSDEQLERRIATLRSEVERASRGRISPTYAQGTSMGMGGGGGFTPTQVLRHNRRVDEQTGRPALIEELEHLLAERSRRTEPRHGNRRRNLLLLAGLLAVLVTLVVWFLVTS